MILFELIIFNVSKELKLKNVSRKIIYKRIKEENIEIVSTKLVLNHETVTTILESFKKEVERVVDSRLIHSFKELKSYSIIVESLYKIELSSLCFELSL